MTFNSHLPPLGGVAWEELGAVALLEKAHHWDRGFEVSKVSLSLPRGCVSRCSVSAVFLV